MQNNGTTNEAELLEAPNRRRFIGTAGIGSVALGAMAAGLPAQPARAQGITDVAIANFALNFEYLGAELYTRAVTGGSLAAADTVGGNGAASGGVVGGHQVSFNTPFVQQFVDQLRRDELGHVRVLRSVLGQAAIAEPAINIGTSFATLAAAAGLGSGFDPFSSENNLLLAAYALEDVCVTALRGAASLIASKQLLGIGGGLLAVEGYQASTIRTLLYQRNLGDETVAISALRAKLSGEQDDQGVVMANMANIVPTNANSLVFARTPRQVLNIAYGSSGASSGGFFPNGVNGSIR